MNEAYLLIWISPILPQETMEKLFQWMNTHFLALSLPPLPSFSAMKVEYLASPADALKLEFEIRGPHPSLSIQKLKEALWSEIFASSHPGPSPYAVSLIPSSVFHTKKKLICFDMDSTLINQEVIDEIARTAGLHERVAEITESAMQGKLDFRASLRERVKLFYRMPKAQAESIIPALTVSPGGEALLRHCRSNGIKTAVVSGGFEFVLRHFQKQMFIDQVYGNVLTVDDDDCFTGEVEDPVVDAAYKQKLVKSLKENYQTTEKETITVGDGANDIPMMTEAGISVSFCGKAKLAAQVNTLILDRNLLWLLPFVAPIL